MPQRSWKAKRATMTKAEAGSRTMSRAGVRRGAWPSSPGCWPAMAALASRAPAPDPAHPTAVSVIRLTSTPVLPQSDTLASGWLKRVTVTGPNRLSAGMIVSLG
jgi:hypothetical protein